MKDLCECSKLEWLPEHYQLDHHPDCFANDKIAVYEPIHMPNYSGMVKTGISREVKPYAESHMRDIVRFGYGSRLLYTAEAFHCGEKSILQTYEPSYELRCKVCGASIFARAE